MAEELKPNAAGTGEPSGSAEVKKISLTEKELNDKLQSEADKRVTQALKTYDEKMQSEFNAKIAQIKEETEKVYKLQGTEREREILAAKERELIEREKKHTSAIREADVKNYILENKLSEKSKELLTGLDEKDWKAQATTLQTIIKDAIDEVRKNEFDPIKLELDQLKAKIGMPSSGNGGQKPDSKETMSVTARTNKFRAIKAEKGLDAANAWLHSLK